jgi:hypothetical protein
MALTTTALSIYPSRMDRQPQPITIVAEKGQRYTTRSYRAVAVGDTVVRLLGGAPMRLRVSEIDERFIHCGPWKFDRDNGIEVDEDLGWGLEFGAAGTYLVEHIPAGSLAD